MAKRLLPCLLFCLSLCLLDWLLFFHGLADRDLWSSHEARAAMDAQTILDEGAWLVPRQFSGRLELQKPPLYYWLTALVGRLRGGTVDAWAVRLPAALAATISMGILAGLGWLRGRPLAGLLAGAVLATAAHFTWLARIARIDMPLTLAVTIAAAAFYLARHGAARSRRVSEGVVALADASPLSSILHPLSSLGLWWGVPLVLALVLPWFVWADVWTDGEFFQVFLWHHNFERGFGGSRLRGHPWWFYGPQFMVDFLPWTPILFLAVLWWWRAGRRDDREARFGLTWFTAVALVLSCARFKRADYLLPAYPGAALFLGCVLEHAWERARGPRRLALASLVGSLCLAMAAVWTWKVGWGLPRDEPGRNYLSFAAHVRREVPPPAPVIFFRAEAHVLAFHTGRPLTPLLQWEQLRQQLARAGPTCLVMPAVYLGEAGQRLPGVALEEIARHPHQAGPWHERPLVLLRASCPKGG
jgi:4-amino-4-deoxy-L-arabinose transferase-like glycosyltransferase